MIHKKKTSIQIEDLHYRYQDGTHALKGLNMTIEKGLSTVILGSNGAGKSTLFLALNGILKPTAGRLYFEGIPYNYKKQTLTLLKRRVGIVFQDPDDQLFSASVIQDISFGAFNLGYAKDIVLEKVNQAMAWTGVSHLKDKPTHMLSFGQKKRVAIAGVLVMAPSVIILDEPTAGLDPRGIKEIMGLLTKLKDELGLTVIMATHDIDLVPEYADYIYVIDGGKNIVDGSIEAVFKQGDLLRSVELDAPRITQLCAQIAQKKLMPLKRYGHTVDETYRILEDTIKAP